MDWEQKRVGNVEIWKCRLHGHHLYMHQLATECEALGQHCHWYKWIDSHFRGSVENLELGKQQLEREAAGEGNAWGTK